MGQIMDQSTTAFVSPAPLTVNTFSRNVISLRRPRSTHQARPDLRVCFQPSMDATGTGIYSPSTPNSDIRVVIFGATGYIGRFVVLEFVRQGYDVIAFARSRSGVGGNNTSDHVIKDLKGARVVFGDVTKLDDVANAFQGEGAPSSTIVVSCLASRTGGIKDSDLIEYEATLNTLRAGRKAGANHFILLSAICVQKPLLQFQRAKLRFEEELRSTADSDPNFSYSIVRPTAFFKSLAGQIDRLKKGAAFVMFENGELCKCNPLSEADLARFMVLCAREEAKRNQILPVGGPGNPVTPKEQAEICFKLLGKEPKYLTLPIGLMDGAIGLLDFFASFLPFAKDAAEFGKIGKYYAVEDMIGPSFGEDTLEDFFARAVKEGGLVGQELGDQVIFK